MMTDHITELASKCGISPDMAKKGLVTLLAAFKHALPAEAFAKIENSIPGASDMLAEAQETGEASSGGILGAIKNMAGKLFGGGSPQALTEHFGQLGFSPDQIKRFMPQVVEFLESKLPPDLLKLVSALLPHDKGAAAH